jgi:hypothetical protein
MANTFPCSPTGRYAPEQQYCGASFPPTSCFFTACTVERPLQGRVGQQQLHEMRVERRLSSSSGLMPGKSVGAGAAAGANRLFSIPIVCNFPDTAEKIQDRCGEIQAPVKLLGRQPLTSFAGYHRCHKPLVAWSAPL